MEFSMETKRKLRDMGASDLLDALTAQGEGMCMEMICAEWVQMSVDEAHSAFVTAKVRNLTWRADLRYPDADARRAAVPAASASSSASMPTSRRSCPTSGCSTTLTSSSGASCSSSWRCVTAWPPRSSARSSARRTGTPGSAAASTPTPSWIASSTAPHGLTLAR